MKLKGSLLLYIGLLLCCVLLFDRVESKKDNEIRNSNTYIPFPSKLNSLFASPKYEPFYHQYASEFFTQSVNEARDWCKKDRIDFSAPEAQTQASTTTEKKASMHLELSIERISQTLSMIDDSLERETLSLDFISIMLEDEISLSQNFHIFKLIREKDSLLNCPLLSSKESVLGLFTEYCMMKIIARSVHLQEKKMFKEEWEAIMARENSVDKAMAMMNANKQNLFSMNNDFANDSKGFKDSSMIASNTCVSCITLKNLMILLCNQNYSPQVGTCVECETIKKMVEFICSFNCTVNPSLLASKDDSKGNSLITANCVYCSEYYKAVELFCGAPNCQDPYYYFSETTEERKGKVLSDDADHDNDRVLLVKERSVGSTGEVQIASSNCVPCYYQFLAYQLVCNDLYDHCSMPTPTPVPSMTPTASMSMTATASMSMSMTPTPSESMTPTASISTTPTPSESMTPSSSISTTPTASISTTPTASISESMTPTPSSVPSITPTPSSYYYYNPWYNGPNEVAAEEGLKERVENALKENENRKRPVASMIAEAITHGSQKEFVEALTDEEIKQVIESARQNHFKFLDQIRDPLSNHFSYHFLEPTWVAGCDSSLNLFIGSFNVTIFFGIPGTRYGGGHGYCQIIASPAESSIHLLFEAGCSPFYPYIDTKNSDFCYNTFFTVTSREKKDLVYSSKTSSTTPSRSKNKSPSTTPSRYIQDLAYCPNGYFAASVEQQQCCPIGSYYMWGSCCFGSANYDDPNPAPNCQTPLYFLSTPSNTPSKSFSSSVTPTISSSRSPSITRSASPSSSYSCTTYCGIVGGAYNPYYPDYNLCCNAYMLYNTTIQKCVHPPWSSKNDQLDPFQPSCNPLYYESYHYECKDYPSVIYINKDQAYCCPNGWTMTTYSNYYYTFCREENGIPIGNEDAIKVPNDASYSRTSSPSIIKSATPTISFIQSVTPSQSFSVSRTPSASYVYKGCPQNYVYEGFGWNYALNLYCYNCCPDTCSGNYDPISGLCYCGSNVELPSCSDFGAPSTSAYMTPSSSISITPSKFISNTPTKSFSPSPSITNACEQYCKDYYYTGSVGGAYLPTAGICCDAGVKTYAYEQCYYGGYNIGKPYQPNCDPMYGYNYRFTCGELNALYINSTTNPISGFCCQLPYSIFDAKRCCDSLGFCILPTSANKVVYSPSTTNSISITPSISPSIMLSRSISPSPSNLHGQSRSSTPSISAYTVTCIENGYEYIYEWNICCPYQSTYDPNTKLCCYSTPFITNCFASYPPYFYQGSASPSPSVNAPQCKSPNDHYSLQCSCCCPSDTSTNYCVRTETTNPCNECCDVYGYAVSECYNPASVSYTPTRSITRSISITPSVSASKEPCIPYPYLQSNVDATGGGNLFAEYCPPSRCPTDYVYIYQENVCCPVGFDHVVKGSAGYLCCDIQYENPLCVSSVQPGDASTTPTVTRTATTSASTTPSSKPSEVLNGCPSNWVYSSTCSCCCQPGTSWYPPFDCCYDSSSGSCNDPIAVSPTASPTRTPSVTASPSASVSVKPSFVKPTETARPYTCNYNDFYLDATLDHRSKQENTSTIIDTLSNTKKILVEQMLIRDDRNIMHWFSKPVRNALLEILNNRLMQLYSEPSSALAFTDIDHWCGGGHGGFQDCCNGQPCQGCDPSSGILTELCVFNCPPLNIIDAACMQHDACTFQNVAPPGFDTICAFNGVNTAQQSNYCPCDCSFNNEINYLKAISYCAMMYPNDNGQYAKCQANLQGVDFFFENCVTCWYYDSNQEPTCPKPMSSQSYPYCIAGSWNS